MAHSAALTDLTYLTESQDLPTLAVLAVRAAATIAKWNERHVTRKTLKTLPYHLLDDVGITPEMARREAGRRFWQS